MFLDGFADTRSTVPLGELEEVMVLQVIKSEVHREHSFKGLLRFESKMENNSVSAVSTETPKQVGPVKAAKGST